MIDTMSAKLLDVPDLRALLASLQTAGRHVAEPKYDGLRATVHIRGGKVLQFTNHASDYPGEGDLRRRFPELVKGIPEAFPPEADLVLDGEVGLLDGSAYKMDYNAVQNRARTNAFNIAFDARVSPMTFAAFDILQAGSEDVWKRPYRERRALLEQLVRPAPRVLLVPTSEDLLGLFDRVSGLGGEGAMLKLLTAAYAPGKKTDSWWKAKSTSYLDNLFVVGLLEGNGALRGNIGTLVLARRDAEGALEYVCKAGAGLTDKMRSDLRKASLGLARPDCPLDPPPPLEGRRVIAWLHPHARAEIHFEAPVETDNVDEGGRKLRRPRFPTLRSVDTNPSPA